MAHDVFVSYSSKDKQIADAICHKLESDKIRCWIAPRDILPGATWGEAIIEAINNCKALIIVFSSSSNSSPQVLREVERAVSKGIFILPVRIEDIKPSGAMEYFLSSQHWTDILTPAFEEQITVLSKNISTLLNNRKKGAQPSRVNAPPPSKNFRPPADQGSSKKLGIIIAATSVSLCVAGFLGILLFSGEEPPPKLTPPIIEENSTLPPGGNQTVEDPASSPTEANPGTASGSPEEEEVCPLHDAAWVNSLKEVKYLVNSGMDVNIRNSDMQTPLHVAVCSSNTTEIIKFLISKGADVNARDADKRTPLHNAAADGKKEFIQLLIAKGADATLKDCEGCTPAEINSSEEIGKLIRSLQKK